jgi:hypothetical protein
MALRVAKIPSSARISRAGFGVAPKQSFLECRPLGANGNEGKVRERKMRSPSCETHALPFTLDYQQLSRNHFAGSPLDHVIWLPK